jgi:hypothetical protein
MFSSIEPACEICYQKFNRTTRIPYVTIGKNVKCDHSTCLECLNKQKELIPYRCPQCGDEINYEEINLPFLKYFNIKDDGNSVKSIVKMDNRIVENVNVNGHYNHWIKGTFKMSFDQFSLKQGKVYGKGKDNIGEFSLLGSYDKDGAIFFGKTYINGNGKVDYEGRINNIERHSFEIQGDWKNGIENWGSFELKGYY